MKVVRNFLASEVMSPYEKIKYMNAIKDLYYKRYLNIIFFNMMMQAIVPASLTHLFFFTFSEI